MTLPQQQTASPPIDTPPHRAGRQLRNVADASDPSTAEPRVEITLMTPDEVCRTLQVTKDWLYDQVEARTFPHLRLGRHLRFRSSDIREYLASRAVPTRDTRPGANLEADQPRHP
jgi:excisionase family DNA binding protein